MKTLSIRSWQRLKALGDELPLVALWIAGFVGIELIGRASNSEFSDAVGVVVILSLVLVTTFRHLRRPLRILARLKRQGRHLARHLGALRIRVGLDLRQDPPLQRRIPPALELALLVALILPPVLYLGRGAFPGDLRALARGLSPLLHTLWLTLFWSVLAIGTIWQFRGPLSYIGEAMERSPRWRAQRRPLQLWLATGYALWLLVCASGPPTATPLLLAGLALIPLALLAHAPGAPLLTMVWRRADGDDTPASLPWTWLTTGMFIGYLGVACLLFLLAAGDGLDSHAGLSTPVSHFLGTAFAWTVPAHLWTAVFHLGRILWQGRREDPAQPLPPRVHVDGADAAIERRRIRNALEPAGFDVAFPPARRDPSDVDITIGGEAPAVFSHEPDPVPQLVPLEEISSPRLRVALARRHELLQRQLLLSGLQRALTSRPPSKKTDQDPEGGDAWIAPHYWFVTHVTRGEQEREQLVGQPYRDLIPLRARHYTHVIFGRLEVDLIVVEQGVRFEELTRVMNVLFEYHDVCGGERLGDERPFNGIPRVRVVLHEHVLDEPFRTKGYPEPDYDNIGRARILHVFRDRGGEQDLVDVPFDLDWEPTPAEPQLVG